jgi:hypothetical protein
MQNTCKYKYNKRLEQLLRRTVFLITLIPVSICIKWFIQFNWSTAYKRSFHFEFLKQAYFYIYITNSAAQIKFLGLPCLELLKHLAQNN